jgi:hypothetical protein
MQRKPAVPNVPAGRGSTPKPGQKPPRRPPQFPLGGLLGLMVVVGIAMAPAYYMVRGQQGEDGSRLAGMLMILAGPLLLMVIVSSLLSLYRWWSRR